MQLVPSALALVLLPALAPALVAVAALVGPSAAQEPALESVEESQLDRVPSPANPGAVFFSRDRELMHPGDPLLVVGLEQDDNSFRDRAPALFASDRAPLQVDADENYRRRLSMYEETALFRVALPSAEPTARRHSERLAARRGGPGASGKGTGNSWLSIPAVVVVGLLVGFWYRHRQGRGRQPDSHP